MRILHLNHLYYPSIGGNQLLNRELAEKLVQMGQDVTVFTANALSFPEFYHPSKGSQKLPSKEIINGVKIKRFNIQHGLRSFLLDKLHFMRGGYCIQQWIFQGSHDIWKFGPFIPQTLFSIFLLKPDIILAVNYHSAMTYVGYLAKKFFKIPYVIMPLTHHCDSWVHDKLLVKIYKAADLLICSTEFERQYLINMGVDEKRIRMMGHGIDLSIFDNADGSRFKRKHGIDEKKPVVLCVGRKIEGKGFEHLINAMPLVWNKYPQVQLVLAGKKYEMFGRVIEDALNKLSHDELKKIFNIDDFLEEEKKDIYAASDIFVLASIVDSFGLVNMEAWALGLPIIACRNTPQETLIKEGEDGLLIDYGNKEQLAEAIISLVGDADKRISMGQRGRARVLKDYTIDIYTKRVLKEYSDLVRREINGSAS